MTSEKPVIARPVMRSDHYRRGEEQGTSKLTEPQVLEIIAIIEAYPDASIIDLAAKRNVSPGCISKIKNDRAWLHIKRPWVLGSHRRKPK